MRPPDGIQVVPLNERYIHLIAMKTGKSVGVLRMKMAIAASRNQIIVYTFREED